MSGTGGTNAARKRDSMRPATLVEASGIVVELDDTRGPPSRAPAGNEVVGGALSTGADVVDVEVDADEGVDVVDEGIASCWPRGEAVVDVVGATGDVVVAGAAVVVGATVVVVGAAVVVVGAAVVEVGAVVVEAAVVVVVGATAVVEVGAVVVVGAAVVVVGAAVVLVVVASAAAVVVVAGSDVVVAGSDVVVAALRVNSAEMRFSASLGEDTPWRTSSTSMLCPFHGFVHVPAVEDHSVLNVLRSSSTSTAGAHEPTKRFIDSASCWVRAKR